MSTQKETIHQVSFDLQHLMKGIELVRTVMPTKPILYQLENISVKILAAKGKAILYSTDLQVNLLAILDIKEASSSPAPSVEATGDFTFLLSKKLLAFLDKLDEVTDVTLEYKLVDTEKINKDGKPVIKYTVKVIAGKENTLNTSESYETFPVAFEAPEGYGLLMELPFSVMQQRFKLVKDFRNKDELRPNQQYICINPTSTEQCDVVATDAHRLIRLEMECGLAVDVQRDTEGAVLFPPTVVDVLLKLPKLDTVALYVGISKEKNDAYISDLKRHNERHNKGEAPRVPSSDLTRIVFDYGDIKAELVYRFEERYPNYPVVIPKDQPIRFEMDRAKLLKLIDKAMLSSNQTTMLGKFSFGAELKITAEDIDMETEYEGTMTAMNVGGNPCDFDAIGFNMKFLTQCLKAKVFEGSSVVFEMSTPSRALTMPCDNGQLLLMPLMIQN